MTTEVKAGDKVRVTYEGVVERVEWGAAWLDKSFHPLNGCGKIEILSRANDPANYLVGTILSRRAGSGGGAYVKTSPSHWTRVCMGDDYSPGYSNDDMQGFLEDGLAGRVVGTIPGSPAAAAQPF